jgi:RHS repeat-associated protein
MWAGFNEGNFWATSEWQTDTRRYTPGLGRWYTPDPIGKAAARLDFPQTWNMYAYVRNNPTTLTDPSGEFNLLTPLLEAVTSFVSEALDAGSYLVKDVTRSKPQDPCRSKGCSVVMTSDDLHKPRGSGDVATREIEYQVRNNKGKDVPNVEVVLKEKLVSGSAGGICGGDGCSNRDSAGQEDFRSGQFHDLMRVNPFDPKSFSVQQTFFVGGQQAPIVFGASTRWSQTADIRSDDITVTPDPSD